MLQVRVKGLDYPIGNVQRPVEAERKEVVGVYDGGDCGLAEEEQLWEHTDGFEDDRQRP